MLQKIVIPEGATGLSTYCDFCGAPIILAEVKGVRVLSLEHEDHTGADGSYQYTYHRVNWEEDHVVSLNMLDLGNSAEWLPGAS